MKLKTTILTAVFTLISCGETGSSLKQNQQFDFAKRASDVDVSECMTEDKKCSTDQLLKLDIQLEDAYWGYTERQEFEQLNNWVQKTYDYIQVSNTPGKGRLLMLAGFARMNIARSGDMFSVKGIGDLANGINLGNGAEGVMKEDTEDQDAISARERSLVSTRIFNLVGEGVLGFATEKNKDGQGLVTKLLESLAKTDDLGELWFTIKQLAGALLPKILKQPTDTESSSEGMASVARLKDLQKEFSDNPIQEHFAREGLAVAAMLQTYAADKNLVQAGIDILEDENNRDLMTLTNGSSPSKSVGMHLAAAEGLVYLGEMERAEEHLEQAKEAARFLPTVLKSKLDVIVDKLLDVETDNGYKQLWAKTAPIGNLRMPLPPSMGADGCSLCHNGAFSGVAK